MASRANTTRWTARLIDGIRELGRTPVRFAVHLAVARLITQWRSLLTIIAGTILAASIGALVPLYTTAVAQVGMTQRLDQQAARDVHVSTGISLKASAWTEGVEQKAAVSTTIMESLVDRDLSVIENWVDYIPVYYETEGMGIALPATEDVESQPLYGVRTRLGYYDGWQDKVRLVSGRMPQDTPANEADDIEIVVGLNVANEVNLDDRGTTITLEPDTILILSQRISSDGGAGGHPTSLPIQVRIVGVVTPLDPEDPYWLEPSPLRLTDRRSGSGQWRYEFNFLTTKTSVFKASTEFIPDTPTRINWRVLFAHDNLPFARVDAAVDALNLFERDMYYTFKESLEPDEADSPLNRATPDLQFNYYTQLVPHQQRKIGLLAEYAKEVDLLDAPFGLLLLQVGALVLFFLMVTAALVRRGERREIAMLQSRGAWDSQIILLRGIEALLICVIAVVVAPFLAQQLLTLLGPYVANTDDFPLPMTGRVFLFAGLAAGVTFLALIFTLRPVLKLPLVTAGGAASRSGSQHWWQKYYLDAMLALVGLGALWLLVRRGSPLADVNLGGRQADPLMLMAPALLFLALGSLALRFFPIFASLASRASASGRGLLNAMATWQLSREPVHYGRITFLLALAIGIGWFATTFRATLTNSHIDQAKYKVGTDVRFVERDTQLNVNRARTDDYYLAQDGIEAASTGFRLPNSNLSSSVQGDLRGTLLAINPDTFGPTLYWRDDLGLVYTPRAPGDTPNLPVPGEELPGVPARIGMWVRLDVPWFTTDAGEEVFQNDLVRLMQRTKLSVRLLDAAGAWIVVPFEAVDVEYLRVGDDEPGLGSRAYVTSGWVYQEADLSALAYAPVGPVRLVSFFWEYNSPNTRGEAGMRLTLAEMRLIDAGGTETPLNPFTSGTWEFMYDRGATVSNSLIRPALNTGELHTEGVYIRWAQDAQRSTIGMNLNYPEWGPIDAVISRRVYEENGLSVGADASPFRLIDIGRMQVQFRAVQVTDYYPSLYDRVPDVDVLGGDKGDSFMIVDVRELLYVINRRPSATYYPSEVWMRFDDSIDSHDEDEVAARLQQLDDSESSGVVIVSSATMANELSKLRTNPLGLGLLGLMYLAFIMALALSVVGLLTYAGLTAQSRRTEFGVLRALGLSSLRVVGALALEQLFVMVMGILLGAGLGWVLSSQVVPTLALGATGEAVVPPFIMQVETTRLLEYGLMMFVVMLLVLSSSLLLVRQLSLARTLRLGEE